MPRLPPASSLWQLLRHELQLLLQFNRSERRWQLPFCAALASGLPLLVGLYFDRLDYGVVSSLGGLVFLYTPATPLAHRMLVLMACSFGMTACYALGILSQYLPLLRVPMLTGIAILIVMLCQVYAIGPPRGLFFMMPAALGAFTPIDLLQLPLQVGLLALGCLLACLIAFIYSLHALRVQAPAPVTPLPAPDFDQMLVLPVVTGLSVGGSLLLAVALQLERPYWVPLTCITVIQGATLHAIWLRQLQRIVGTAIGLLLAMALLGLPLAPWHFPLVIIALTFVVESLVVRQYGLAVIFITPMTLLLAEAARIGLEPADSLLQARLLDTLVGSVAGLLGGVVLHTPRLHDGVGRALRRLTPARLRR